MAEHRDGPVRVAAVNGVIEVSDGWERVPGVSAVKEMHRSLRS